MQYSLSVMSDQPGLGGFLLNLAGLNCLKWKKLLGYWTGRFFKYMFFSETLLRIDSKLCTKAGMYLQSLDKALLAVFPLARTFQSFAHTCRTLLQLPMNGQQKIFPPCLDVKVTCLCSCDVLEQHQSSLYAQVLY